MDILAHTALGGFDTLGDLDAREQMEREAAVAAEFFIDFLPSGAVQYWAKGEGF